MRNALSPLPILPVQLELPQPGGEHKSTPSSFKAPLICLDKTARNMPVREAWRDLDPSAGPRCSRNCIWAEQILGLHQCQEQWTNKGQKLQEVPLNYDRMTRKLSCHPMGCCVSPLQHRHLDGNCNIKEHSNLRFLVLQIGVTWAAGRWSLKCPDVVVVDDNMEVEVWVNEGPSGVRNRFSLEVSRMLEELSRVSNQWAITMLLH